MTEKLLTNKKNGMAMLLLFLAVIAAAAVAIIVGANLHLLGLIVAGVIVISLIWIPMIGLRILKPQEALVLTLFGRYYGTLKGEGYYYVNPFCTGVNPAAKTRLSQSGDVKTLSVKAAAGDTSASLEVDTTGDGIADDGSLRGSSELVASRIRGEIQQRVAEAGIEIIEARITYLAYATEIAAVMLQRQQASAIIDARKMIVEGAVGMVEMALERLSESGMVELDEERKAAMVSNLLVVLCGNHDAQPVVNSGSLY